MSQRLSDKKWLQTHLSELIEMTKTISKIENNIYYEAKFLSPLKLISLMLYLKFYTTLAPRDCKLFYIDLLADSGLNKIERDFVAGSPIIAHSFAYRKFDNLLLCEINPDHAKALNLRLQAIGADYKLFGNCNIDIDKIISFLKKDRSNFLAFVDYEGFEVEWQTVKKLLDFPFGDVVFTFQTQEIRRVWGQWRSYGEKYETYLNKLYGDDAWKKASNEDDLLDIFITKIKQYRSKVTNIDIKTKRKGLDFHYNLIFATRQTRGGSPWFDNVIGSLKERVERNPGEYVKTALDILAGRITDLDKFLS